MTNELQWQEDLTLVQETLARGQGAIAEFAARMKCIPIFLNAMNQQGYRSLSRERLEDAAQEATTRIWRDRPLFTGQSRLETWAYPYAMHVYRESVAAQAKTDYRRADHDTIYSLYSSSPTVGDALDVQTEAARVRQAMSSMKPELVTLIERHLLLGRTFPEIAEEEGLNLNTVKARYYRALKALRDILGQEAGPTGGGTSRTVPPIAPPSASSPGPSRP